MQRIADLLGMSSVSELRELTIMAVLVIIFGYGIMYGISCFVTLQYLKF